MSEYPKLIFPAITAKIKSENGKEYIWDSLRKRWLLLTPEEWVRQHTIRWFVECKNIFPERVGPEYPVNVNGQNQRADIVILNEFARPFILVECKAPDVEIDKEVVMQACRYNAIIGARYVVLTNGLQLHCFEYADGKYRAVERI